MFFILMICLMVRQVHMMYEVNSTDGARKIFSMSTKKAFRNFHNEESRLFDHPRLNKGYYKKWTPEGEKVSKDARLLGLALEIAEEETMKKENETAGQDYALGRSTDYSIKDDVDALSKTDKIKLILNDLEMLSKEASAKSRYSGSDYMNVGSTQSEDKKSSCVRKDKTTCDALSRYRTQDGSCNHLTNSDWGKQNIPLRRMFPRNVSYEDGIGEPKKTVKLEKKSIRLRLPNARFISLRVHENKVDSKIYHDRVSHMMMQWGQFLDHDITLSPEPELQCCSPEIVNKSRCFNIMMDQTDLVDMPTDPIHLLSLPNGEQKCIAVSRSEPACDTGVGFEDGVESKREQLNSITAYVDGSNLYGSDVQLTNALRRKKDKVTWLYYGFLEVNHGNFRDLPSRKQVNMGDKMGEEEFKISGDMRCVEHPALLSMHTLWLNEHNRIARKLWNEKPLRTHLDKLFGKDTDKKDDLIFQETRRIVSAVMQKITYGEWLPEVLGPKLMKEYDLNIEKKRSKYDDNVDPSIINEFSTVSFRFGHTLVGSQFGRVRARTEIDHVDVNQLYNLQEVFFDENRTDCVNTTCVNLQQEALSEDDLCTNTTCEYWSEDVLFGLITLPAEKDDLFLNEDLINSLFLSKEIADSEKQHKKHAESSDLAARNIQRGRDHGLPGYNLFRTQMPGSTLQNLNSFGIKKCDACMQITNDRQLFCNPILIPDRECEDCLQFKDYIEMAKSFQENSPQITKCSLCVQRKCKIDCVPEQVVDDKKKCARCFQDQIIAIHSCENPYRDSKFVDNKCECKACMDKNAARARELRESDLGITVEDFIRINEPYCWHMDSIDPFTGTLAEISVEGGLQGPTNARLTAQMFSNLKKGDRYFFTHQWNANQQNKRGLERKILAYVKQQSLASVLCNNLKDPNEPGQKKSDIMMKENPFLINSPWKRCSDIIAASSRVKFKAIVNHIIKGNKKKSIRDCRNAKECQDKFKQSDYQCQRGQCQYIQQACFTKEDCEDSTKDCNNGRCASPPNGTCAEIGCTEDWMECKSSGSHNYCTCKYSNHVLTRCKQRP